MFSWLSTTMSWRDWWGLASSLGREVEFFVDVLEAVEGVVEEVSEAYVRRKRCCDGERMGFVRVRVWRRVEGMRFAILSVEGVIGSTVRRERPCVSQ